MNAVEEVLLESFSAWIDNAIVRSGDARKVFSAILAISIFELYRCLPENEADKLLGDVVEAVREEVRSTSIH